MKPLSEEQHVGVNKRPVKDPSPEPCRECGTEGFELHWCAEHRAHLLERMLCFSCDFWLEVLADKSTHVVVDGVAYALRKGGPVDGEPERWGLGHGGRTFIFERLDAARVECSNVWCRGNVPERFRDRLPDDAVIVEPED